MGLSSAMDWWDEWKLRFLVLCSLFVQFFLIFSAYVRRSYILRWLRILLWIAYIGGDALAIYALATLFNRQKQQTTADGGGGNALEVIWAPVLLIHLGGQTQISAYSLEDNELWKRHAITMVSQVTVALYVFCKWWSGEKWLFQAAVLLFIGGIIKFGQKPWALRRASFGTVASTNFSPSRRRQFPAWSAFCCADVLEMAGQEENKYQEASYSLEKYVEEARAVYKEAAKTTIDEDQQEKEFRKNRIGGLSYILRTFLDLSAPYSARLHYLKSFLKFDDVYAHRMVMDWIEKQYFVLYTRVRSGSTFIGYCFFFLLPSLALASVVLFIKSGTDGYNKSDVMVTRILFAATAVLEFAPFWVPFISPLSVFINKRIFNQKIVVHTWQDMVSQHSIMLFCARKKEEPSTLMKLPGFSYLRDCIIKHWYIWRQPAAQQISGLVRQHVEDGWKEHIRDPPTYRRFSNLRGEQTLRKHHLLKQLGWTFCLPFDECVLVWHIATDLCSFHRTDTSSSQQADAIIQCRSNSEIISNHMIYLLFVCPEMLVVGTRHDLFMIACDDIQPMIKDEPLSSLDKGSIARRILGMEGDDDLIKESKMISDAHRLAKLLIALDDDKKRWEVIQGVWVEMLCYSASRCRGYEHAKSLAHGGEFLTNVWLLWSVMGMETLPDKNNNPGSPELDDHDEEQAPAAASAAASG